MNEPAQLLDNHNTQTLHYLYISYICQLKFQINLICFEIDSIYRNLYMQ